MNIREKLQTLSEDDLRKKVIIPMMYALGCINVRDTHGPYEKGKDVVYEVYHLFRRNIYGAIIVKNKRNIGKSDLENLHRQANEALVTFKNPNDPRNEIKIHELTIMTSYRFSDPARDYIFENCGRNFPNIHIINGASLESIILGLISDYETNTKMKYQFNISTFKDFCDRMSGRNIMISEPIGNPYKKEEGQEIKK